MTLVSQKITDNDNGWAMLRNDRNGGPAIEGEMYLIVSKAIDADDLYISEEHREIEEANIAAKNVSLREQNRSVRIIKATFVATGNPGESAMIDFIWVPGMFFRGELRGIPKKESMQA